jgi:hypothetical protein
MSDTASSAERPRHGRPAAWAALPRKPYSTLTSPLLVVPPQLVVNLSSTCVKSTASTSRNSPSRTKYALPATSSSAVPGHRTSVPGSFSRSISRLSATAAVTLSGTPALWPSPCPGAPATSGLWKATPGVCDACGIPSTSLPSAITGRPDPHRATQAVGTPLTPVCTAKPWRRSSPVRKRAVSVSWKPNSP